MEDPTNQVIFLSGASRGIGRSIAASFAREGVAKMCLVARSLHDLQETAKHCEQVNPACKGNLLLCALDVCDAVAVESAVSECAKTFGKVTIAVHNVGAHGIHSVLDNSLGTIRRLIELNLLSVMNLSRLLFPLMIETQKKQQTRTIFLSSALAQRFAMTPGWSAYTSAKCGIAGYSDSVFSELRQIGMKVTTIYPGLVNTDMGTDFTQDFGKILDMKIPKEEFVQAQDVADAVIVTCHKYVANITELCVNPQKDLYRMGILTEPAKVQKIYDSPFPNFEDRRVALITGAGKGIGRGIALQLAGEGYHLAVVARTQSDLDSLRDECNAIAHKAGFNTSVITIAIDVAQKEALKACVAKVITELGTISTVISNAGTNRRKSAALASIDVWEEVIHTNLVSAMHLTALTLPHLLRHAKNSASKSSFLVFMNSMYSNSRAQVLPGTSIYTTTKSGLAGFSRSVLEDVRSWGVKVISVFPGLVNTELGNRPNPQQRSGKVPNLLPPEELVQVEDIAKVVSYVCNTRSNCVVNEITIDSQWISQPLLRNHINAFSSKHWPKELLKEKAKL